ncbi:MAG: NtaA/DmoA family FMN-dependent monooxygenase, partial [Alphaproteobacteria bacterium]|nr:NtaA/DmoA family FMN-dependent monooxygenase [Alphaproteobacteria bacterium]
MAAQRFHLAWFTNFAVDEWNLPLSSAGGEPWDGQFYVDFAKALERACFDYIMLEDTLMVSEAYGHSMDHALKMASMVPKHDPAPLAALLGASTTRLGVVSTLSTLGYPPFLLARLCSTLDHMARGRFGWNIVTSGEDAAAQNFGLPELPPRQLRYDMADEYMDLVCKLWDSWAEGAIVKDRDADRYADAAKVKTIDFVGKWFKSRGPLNTARSPQGYPTFVQAGGSPRGRQFAAQWADSIIAVANGIPGMKAYRDDVRERAARAGRNPDDIKVLFLVAPVLGETADEARAKHERQVSSPSFINWSLGLHSAITDIDFSKYDLDQPLPEKLTTNGESGSLDKFQQWGSGKTLRQLLKEGGNSTSVQLVGTPDQVADQMAECMQAVGGDGWLIKSPLHR